MAKKPQRPSSADSTQGTIPSGSALEQDDFLDGLKTEGKARMIGPVRLQSRISRGGMGIVYRGRHVKLDIDVAVKFLLPNLANQNPEYVIRFEREAKIAAQLNNENLVRVFDVDSEKNYHYVVMELVCGETARDRVARKGPLSEHESIEIILGATRGLEAAHRKGIVHRDIKPENIMIDATGVVKLADLGIAKMVEESEGHSTQANITQPGFVMGTPSFMPPEQFHDSSSVGFAGDIYSMGATLYFLLTGKPPYSGNIYEIVRTISSRDFPDIRKERVEVSDRVVDILRRCTLREPRERFPDASALLLALETSGTDRRKLDEADMGTVTAVARVSTPPARRVGEIRLELPDDGKLFDEVHGQQSPSRIQGHRRGMFALAGIAAFALCFAVGLFLARDKGEGLRQAREKAGESPGEPAGAAQKPPAVASSPPIDVTPARDTTPPRDSKPPPTAPPAVIPEKKIEPPPEPPVIVEVPAPKPVEKTSEEKTPAEKLREANVRLEERRRYNGALLQRARELVRSGDTLSARNIFESVKDWGELGPEASRVKLESLLVSSPPRESEARDYVRALCAEPGASETGSACDLCSRAIYAYVQEVPLVGSGPTAWERRIELWKSLGSPPSSLPTATSDRAAAREKLLSTFLAFLAENARRSVLAEDVPGARKQLERADKLIKDEKLERGFPRETASLDAQRKAAASLEAELSEWLALAPLYPSAAPLSKLEDADLKQRVDKFLGFSRKYPQSPRKPTAENYRKRYQDEVERREKP